MQLCVFGDSVSKGIIYKNNRYFTLSDGFADLVSKKKDLLLKNFSKLGSTVQTGKNIFDKNSEEMKKSDFIAFEFGGNDCNFIWKDISEMPTREHQPKTDIDTYAEIYIDMIEKAKKVAPVFILNLPPLDAEKFFNHFSTGLDKEVLRSWLGGKIEYIYRWHEMYNQRVTQIALQTKVKLIDIRSCFLLKANYSDLLCADGIHPNEDGHRLISQAILEQIKDITV